MRRLMTSDSTSRSQAFRFAGLAATAILAAAVLVQSGCKRGYDDEEEATGSSLDSREVEGGLRSQQAAVDGCISRAHGRNPGISGAVVVAGTIGTDGRVEEARVSRSSTGDRRLDDCILAETRLARFPSAGMETGFEHEWTVARTGAPRRAPRDEESAWAVADPFPGAKEAAGDAPPPMRGAAISEMAQQDAEAINACYAAAVAGRPEVQGSIQVSWAIDPGGSVRSAVVTGGSLDDSAVADCIVQRVLVWRFAPTGGAGLQQASFTWQFRQE